MNLKQNKGYVGIDMSVGVIILLILVPTIMGIIFGINASKSTTEVKTQAVNIMVNALETAKGMELSGLNTTSLLQNFASEHQTEYTTTIENNHSAIVEATKASFRLEVSIKDYHENNAEALENVVKTVTATVTYKVGNKEDSMNLSTVVN